MAKGFDVDIIQSFRMILKFSKGEIKTCIGIGRVNAF